MIILQPAQVPIMTSSFNIINAVCNIIFAKIYNCWWKECVGAKKYTCKRIYILGYIFYWGFLFLYILFLSKQEPDAVLFSFEAEQKEIHTGKKIQRKKEISIDL